MHVNEFPVEILSEIFKLATRRQSPTDTGLEALLNDFHPRCAPFSLILVCKHWKNVASSTPSLWNFLDATQYKARKPSMSMIKSCLRKSRNSPLHLRLSSSQDFEGRSFDTWHARNMFQLFRYHAHQWRSLSIELSKDLAADLLTVLQNVTINPPPLASLEIEFRHSDVEATVIDALAASLHRLKSLRQLHWMHVRGSSLPQVPWGQLDTVFIETSFDLEEAAECLAKCASATSVSILGCGDPSHPAVLSNDPFIALNMLTSLTLNKSSDPLPLLSCFTLPALQYLEIGIYQRDFQALEALIERSKCALETLIVIDITFSADDVASFFAFQWLKGIPDVRLGPAPSEEKMLKILEQLKAKRAALPPLAVWVERHSGWPMFVGWKESGLRGVRYVFKNGQVVPRQPVQKSQLNQPSI